MFDHGSNRESCSTCINSSLDDAVPAIKGLIHAHGAALSLECSGSQAARIAAIRGLKVWSKAACVGEGGDSMST